MRGTKKKSNQDSRVVHRPMPLNTISTAVRMLTVCRSSRSSPPLLASPRTPVDRYQGCPPSLSLHILTLRTATCRLTPIVLSLTSRLAAAERARLFRGDRLAAVKPETRASTVYSKGERGKSRGGHGPSKVFEKSKTEARVM